jgi:hypothetical protein
LPSAAASVVGGLCVLAVFRIVGAVVLKNFALDLGSIFFPSPLQAAFTMTWTAFGGAAALALCAGMAKIALRKDAADSFERDWLAASDFRFVLACSALAFLFSVAVSLGLLRGARLTDDESAYLFMSELIARGRLTMPSHAMPRFFDNAFMINDGQFYAKYFVGWPLLLAPGTALGVPELMNPIYLALTVPALYGVLKQLLPLGWARAGTVLLVSSPMLIMGAATRLSHTSCMFALTWAWLWALRAGRPEARTRDHAACAALLALACFIRPSSALGIGLPLGVAWLAGLRTRARPEQVRALLAMGAVIAVSISLFLFVNLVQTGDPFKIAYQRSGEFDAEIGFRYTAFDHSYEHAQYTDPLYAISVAALGLMRMHFDLLGWPIGIVLAMFAVGLPQARMPLSMLGCFIVLHLPMTDAGIDMFGPAHFFETALPLLVLITLGMARLSALVSGLFHGKGRVLLPSGLCALLLCAWIGYFPVRAQALVAVAQDILHPNEAVRDAGLHRAVVFVPRPWAYKCLGAPTQPFVYSRPNNDPELENDILWVNNLSLEQNRALMRHFPDRQGYVLLRGDACRITLMPLDQVSPDLAATLPMN